MHFIMHSQSEEIASDNSKPMHCRGKLIHMQKITAAVCLADWIDEKETEDSKTHSMTNG